MAQDLTMKVIEVKWPTFQMTVGDDVVLVWDGGTLVGVLVYNNNGWADVRHFNPAYAQYREITTIRVYQQLTGAGIWKVVPQNTRG
jgi:hypothetical protein